MSSADINQRRVKTNGIELNIAEQGEGPLVLMLHGFPESWYSWRHQFAPLAAAGSHCSHSLSRKNTGWLEPKGDTSMGVLLSHIRSASSVAATWTVHEVNGAITFGRGGALETTLTAIGDADVFVAHFMPDGWR